MAKRGSSRDPGKLSLNWEMFFWHPSEFDEDGKPIERNARLHDGFESVTGSGQSISVEILHDGATLGQKSVRGHDLNLDPIIAGRTGRFTMKLTPSDQLLSDRSAGPHLDSKGGQFNPFFDILLRPVEFEFELGDDGAVTTPTPDALLAVRDPAPEPINGAPSRPRPGPHAYVFVHTTRGRGRKVTRQVIAVDWKPDWIARHSPVPRPMRVGRDSEQIREIILHITDGPAIAGGIQGFLRPTIKNKKGEIVDNTKGIHYIVDLDGHVVKLLHERFGAFHAAHKRKVHLAAWGSEERAAKVAKTSIGIEHAAAPGKEWPAPMLEASLDLVQQLVNHFGIRSRDVVGHNDVIVLKSTRALPIETKACPAGGLPWDAYQDKGLSLAPDAGPQPDDIYGGVFATRDRLDGKAPKEVITELQDDLIRIGWWVPEQRGGRRRFGTFDDATQAGIKRFQARFMARHSLKFKKGKVDLTTAKRIKQVVAALSP